MFLSLRQKKIFQSKNSLANAFFEKLKTEKFDTISIKDVCSKTDVSEATFFNYFPQKTDIIAYLLKTRLFKIYWTLNELQKSLSFTQLIEKTFELFAKQIEHPFIFFEVISIVGTKKMEMASFALSPEELQFLYPECENIGSVSVLNLHDFFFEKISNAKAKNELPKTLEEETLLQFLMTILHGVPLSTSLSEFGNLSEIYRKQLSALWKIFKI